ncbi:MAG: helix-turn-helix domain-containing protein [Muribaculaceae bacterium]
MKTRVVIIIVCLVVAIYGVQSVSHYEAYDRWSTISAEQLLANGARFLDEGQADSAMICFSIVTDNVTSREHTDNEVVAQAYISRWRILFYYYYDYGKAIESLTQAERYAESRPHLTAEIEMDYGITYHTMGIQCNDSSFLTRAFEKYKQALKLADPALADVIISNTLELAFVNGLWEQSDSIWSEYRQMYDGKEPSWTFTYNTLMYSGMDAMQRSDAVEAVNSFDSQIALFSDEQGKLRHRLMAYINRAKALDMCGRYGDAIASVSQSEALADSAEVKDAQLEIYALKSLIYRHGGNGQDAERYNTKYLELKSDILTYKQLRNITEQGFLSQLQEISDNLRLAQEKQRRMYTIACISAIFTIAISVLLILIYKKNRALREKNIKLYRNIEEMAAQPAEKYKRSNLDDKDKEALREKIRAVLEGNDEIYSVDFSAQRLAEIVGEPYKNVSQTINECYGCNFNALINGYRVREACRRMGDPQQWGNLTIEGIGQSVGFKSRSTFISAFKANTGLTPTEYLRIASEQ